MYLVIYVFLLMIRRPPRSTRTEHSFPTRRSSDLSLRFIKSDFVDFLGLFHLPERCISIGEGEQPGEIAITVTGPWLHTILFEIPVLAIVNEAYFRNKSRRPDWEEGRQRLQSKMHLVLDDPPLAVFRVAGSGTDPRRKRANPMHYCAS